MFTKIVPPLGHMKKIDNTLAHFNAEPYYYHVKVNLENQRANLLFTKKDIEKAMYRVQKNPEDIKEQIEPDKEVFSSNLWWAVYSGIVTVSLATALITKFLGY